MPKFSLILCVLTAAFGLSACQQPAQEDPSYLTRHPRALILEVAACHSPANSAKAMTSHCALVFKIHDQVISLIDEQRKDPEKFGQSVITAQMEYGQANLATRAALQQVQNLRAKPASEKDIGAAEIKYTGLLQKQDSLKNKVYMLLAIIGLSSPE
jgi:hypothetical protein